MQKFAFTHKPGGKNNFHGAGWINGVVSAVKAGTAPALKRLSIAYHGIGPHLQDDLSEPLLARPSAEPVHPVDLPNVQGDQLRTVDATPLPTTHGMKPANVGGAPSGTIPAKLG